MSFWNHVSPTEAARDFAQLWRDNPYRWRTLAVAMAMTAGLIILVIPKTERAPPAKWNVTYITTFAPGRTRAEIMASNIEHQKLQDELAAQEKERENLRKQFYEELGRATFVDVDAMKKRMAEQEAEQKKADAEHLAPIEEVQGPAGK